MKAIIGYTGFVGSNLIDQTKFDYLFNSSNISELKKNAYDMMIIAAPSAVKWKANQEPETDLAMVNNLLSNLSGIKVDFVIHISTIDVYQNPNKIDENTIIDTSVLHPYGKHRFLIEEYVRKNYPHHLVIRLPGLFGKNLKKNFIFDMLNNNALNYTHKDSVFQLYDLNKLWQDINTAIKNNIRLLNIATEPVSASEIASRIFNTKFTNVTEKSPVNYNMKSIHFKKFGGERGYLYSKKQVFSLLIKFVSQYQKL